MEVKIKKLNPLATIPAYAHIGDAGMDLTAVSKTYDDKGNVVYGTGLAMEIPTGYVGLVFPRSSNSKKNLWLTNSVGVIDSTYRGEIMLKYRCSVLDVKMERLIDRIRLFFDNHAGNGKTVQYIYRHDTDCEYEVGERVGQIILVRIPNISFCPVDTLSETERGEGGYGSTGK